MDNENNKTIYLMMSYTGSGFSKLLKLLTKEPYPHVSISFDRNLTDMYSFGRRKIYNPLNGGFIQENINKGMYKAFRNVSYEVYSLNITEKQYSSLKQAIEEFNSEQDMYHYNILGLFTYNFNITYERKYYYFCTQFVDTVFKRAGIYLNDKPSVFVGPNDFRKNSQLTYVCSAHKI